ncbi:MAG: bifunctional diaminohydroxyphosphoribosylaminopyrimidine deaminase/5-amino-6-(5-phosphoribosylamino)uracil reductase RibD [Alphaproteobacteria bacterium]|nr:bifunctional diaminohydroxyphosphoribosylaminopyrimidine deaminase/5-amino-6-(5-phosphoribosylamino)uracil reductase RibD [Alphaproteobacteria bacterium]
MSYIYSHKRFMQTALRLAQRGFGKTWPNPTVGCVIVDTSELQKKVIGSGFTQPAGSDHAESVAIKQALNRYGKDKLFGATLYTSLEPCCHQGKTPPCTELIINNGISTVVVGCKDPDSRVSGQGIDILREAGIEVLENVLRHESESLNAGFFTRLKLGRPLVTMKVATSADGQIATAMGKSKWITSELARKRAHLMRAQYDALIVGIGTVLKDDPLLTCRLNGLEDRSPIRVVIDSNLRINPSCNLVLTSVEVPTWIFTVGNKDAKSLYQFQKNGTELISVSENENGLVDLNEVLDILGDRGISRVLSEGGSILNSSLIRSNLVDQIAWFRSTKLIGGDGRSVFESIGVKDVDDMIEFELTKRESIGDETLDLYRRMD